ncbi:MAG: tRNA (guanosine(37)-N1)-methyltransferase TrmD [Leptonema sp. (in: bacteria)]
MFLYQIITIFPERYHSYFNTGLLKKAIEKKIIQYSTINLLDFAIKKNKKKKIDDKPYGGGPGMVLRIEPVWNALNSLPYRFPVIAMNPSGIPLNQNLLEELAKILFSKTQDVYGLTFLSGYYEGFDQRILDHLVDLEISLGNFILNSGDPAIIAFIDAFSRLLPNFLGKAESNWIESFKNNLIEYPQYTKPKEFKGWKVPEVLLSGHHKMIEKWRYEKSMEKTKKIQYKDLL